LKQLSDPRHLKRVERFKSLFSYSFGGRKIESSLGPDDQLFLIIDNLDKIDDYIQGAAPEWPIARLNKVDLAILRLSVYELLIEKKTPPKVVIDEAVELGKMYGSDNTPKFVNGVLGSLLKKRTEE
jgi:transcription antitermination protein NusB